MKKTPFVLTILFLLLFASLAHADHFNERFWLSGTGYRYYVYIILNIDPKVNFYTGNGYSLNSELCQGEKFKVDIGTPTGEWVGEGGAHGSPPVAWVENIGDFLEKVKTYTDKRPKYRNMYETIPNVYDGYVDELTGIPVYNMKIIGTDRSTEWYISLVCELPKFRTVNVSGADVLSENSFRVTTNDKLDISLGANLSCVFYYFCSSEFTFGDGCGLYRDVFTLNEERNLVNSKSVSDYVSYTTIGTISDKQSITITKTPSEPRINLESTLTNTELSPQSSTYLKANIKNTGNKEITIKDINLNINSQFLTCKSTKLSPGESTECIFSVLPKQTSTIEATVKYQYMKCGERQYKTESFGAGFVELKATECSEDSDCSEGYICCEKLCYDSGEGMCADVNADGIDEWVPL